MNDSKTLIRSSIISLIIVILGLFMLCVGRSPQINLDEPLIEGDDFFSESSDVSDDDFLSLLESSDSETSKDENTEFSGDLYTDNTLDEGEATEDDLSEILKLLDMADENESSSYETEENEDSELEKLLYQADEEYTEGSGNVTSEEYSNLEQEISRLEDILAEKDSEIDNITQSINDYDKQISEMEGGKNYPGGSTSNVQFASYNQDQGTASTAGFSGDEFGATSEVEEQYRVAMNYFHNGDYQVARLAFQKLLQQNPRHSLADNCQYWIGECQFARGNYYQAIVEFEKVFSFDAADKKDDAQIMIGLAYMKSGQTNYARDDFAWLMTCYANSEYYQRALRYMREL